MAKVITCNPDPLDVNRAIEVPSIEASLRVEDRFWESVDWAKLNPLVAHFIGHEARHEQVRMLVFVVLCAPATAEQLELLTGIGLTLSDDESALNVFGKDKVYQGELLGSYIVALSLRDWVRRITAR